jgi:high-affinity iron transporter
MLLDIIILVLRETLEVGALLSVLLCVSNQSKHGLNWLWMGLTIGCIAAIFYAANFSAVGETFDYAGQEVLDASIQTIVCICLLVICCLLILQKQLCIVPIMTVIIALSITRELTEMIIFYTGFFQSQGDIGKALTSGFIGLMIGVSFGVLCYVAIVSWRLSISRKVQIALITLIAAGISVQATQLLIQVDWISASKPVWDTGWILSESSILGQLTYAVLGYEATPTYQEVVLYSTVILIITSVSLVTFMQKNRKLEQA